ncbi:hypothetical protein ABID81_003122 [Frigoribacterium sp. PvP054]|uniref:hypothetical protein n=1 Tax=Frigoribacterium sp. PvP054 TaxID=3156438 RepID=UPI00339085BF
MTALALSSSALSSSALSSSALSSSTLSPSTLSPFVHPFGNLALTIAVLLVVVTLSFTLPLVVAARKDRSTVAVDWADQVRADPAGTWTVDRVMRALIGSCEREHVVFPGMVRLVVGLDRVDVDLASPTVAPPAPWSTTVDGRTWSASLAALHADGVAGDRSGHFSTTVALGSSPDGRTHVELAHARGPVAVSGDRAAVVAVARRIADQLATSPWSSATALATVGLTHDEVALGAVLSLDDAVARVVENGRPGVLLLADVPGRDAWAALRAALERPDSLWGVVVLTATAEARWSFTARRDGRLEAGPFGELRWVDVALSATAAPSATPDGDAAATAAPTPVGTR